MSFNSVYDGLLGGLVGQNSPALMTVVMRYKSAPLVLLTEGSTIWDVEQFGLRISELFDLSRAGIFVLNETYLA